MLVRELKILLSALDDNAEVMICNHHLEDASIVDASIRNRKVAGCKNPSITLYLNERKL